MIAHAAAFSIRPRLGPDGFDFDPVLFAPKPRPADGPEEPREPLCEAEALLPPQLQQKFAQDRFRQGISCRPSYTLANGYYLVFDPDVQAALDVARKAQLGDRETRQAFARNPRAFLREALEERLGEEALEQLFVETVEFSSRVRELGLWQPPVLPWVQREAGNWLPDDPGTWPAGGLVLPDGRRLKIPPGEVRTLQAAVEEAVAAGRATVSYNGAEIPASAETAEALAQLPGATQPERKAKEAREEKPVGRRVLLIADNFEALEFRRQLTPRSDHGAEGNPDNLVTVLKDHQREGLVWLKEAWRMGEPGVLLADDMGLGKTLQGEALVFVETQALQPVLAAIAKRRFGLAESPRIINGSVAGDKRQGHVTAFQNGPGGFDLMILGPRAAGIGLTLTAANHVIHLSRWWNPAVEDQCTDRVYRIGQDKPVTVHLPQALLPDAPEQSFDSQLHRLIERKRSLSRGLLAAPAGTDADMEELYRSTIGQ